MARIGRREGAIRCLKRECYCVPSTGEVFNMGTVWIYLRILAICARGVIPSPPVIATKLGPYIPILTAHSDHESTETRPKNLALFVSDFAKKGMLPTDWLSDAISTLGDRSKTSSRSTYCQQIWLQQVVCYGRRRRES